MPRPPVYLLYTLLWMLRVFPLSECFQAAGECRPMTGGLGSHAQVLGTGHVPLQRAARLPRATAAVLPTPRAQVGFKSWLEAGPRSCATHVNQRSMYLLIHLPGKQFESHTNAFKVTSHLTSGGGVGAYSGHASIRSIMTQILQSRVSWHIGWWGIDRVSDARSK